MAVPRFYNFDDPLAEIGKIGEFWQWAMSDLLGNRNRGILAEYIVGKLIGADLSTPRLEWDCYDLVYGDHKIEVKSSAYIQTWHQPSDKRSTPQFGIAPHECWDARTNSNDKEKRRWADVYVFCVFPADRKSDSRDVLDLNQWRFYVATTKTLDMHITAETKSIGMTKVRQICGEPVLYSELKSKIDSLLG